MISRKPVLSCALISAAMAVPAWALPMNWTSAQGDRAASASFDVIGTSLVITLSNTSASDVMVPADLLTGVFFDISGTGPTLIRTSAVLAPGSSVVFGSAPVGGAVGGEWAFKSNLGGPSGTDYGISATGLGLFGPGDRFPGLNLANQENVGGMDFGILSVGDDTSNGNSAVTGGNPLIKHAVIFTLDGVAPSFDPSRIGNVHFQYGTDLDEPRDPGSLILVPEPLTALLLIGGLPLVRRRVTR